MKQGIKKAVVGILAVSMVASVGAVSAFAAGTGRNFADADGNGVCDNYSVEQTVSRAAGALQKGSGQNFVDADNDGICDNYAVGQATGQETASSLNRGQNYVDEDGNGTVSYTHLDVYKRQVLLLASAGLAGTTFVVKKRSVR